MGAVRHEMQALRRLKVTQLHQLAVSLGSACSGNKGTIIDGICHALDLASQSGGGQTAPLNRSAPPSLLSIVSIDMGIQNLAYSHLTVPLQPASEKVASGGGQKAKIYITRHTSYDKKLLPKLQAWERLSVSALIGEQQENLIWSNDDKPQSAIPGPPHSTSRYAIAAYKFIDLVLRRHNPTHILIEQQRFRTGGNPAVAEWTLRVGLFEGMLHAVLLTLHEEKKRKDGKEEPGLRDVVSLDPSRTAKFWLENRETGADKASGKLNNRQRKQAKIDIVAQSLLGHKHHSLVDIGSSAARAMQSAFLSRWQASSRVVTSMRLNQQQTKEQEEQEEHETQNPPPATEPTRNTAPPIPAKLDDLADCLLQALAWLQWQRTREAVRQDLANKEPADALAALHKRLDGPVDASVAKPVKSRAKSKAKAKAKSSSEPNLERVPDR